MAKLKRTALFSAIIALILGALALSVFFRKQNDTAMTRLREVSVELASAENVDIVINNTTEYSLIYSQDSFQGDQALASELKSLLPALKFATPDTKAEVEFEILIGNTNRAVSSELLEKINEANPELYTWGYAYKDGKLAYASSSEIGFEIGKSEFLALVSEDGMLSVPSDLLVIHSMTKEEYEKIVAEREAQEREEHLAELNKLNNAFSSNTKLTTGYVPMIAEDGQSPYDAPWVYPNEGQHPRFLITSDNVKTIKQMMDMPEYKALFYNLWKYAEIDINNGVFPDKRGSSGEIYRYDTDILAGISARALAYLLTGDEVYAYEAIVGIKNAMLTLKFTEDVHMDTYHGASHVMVVLAAVYDWCYPVLTEADKEQLITGTVTCLVPSMEVGYPPSKYNGVTGHGTGLQILRDYMSLAVAFYDAAPDWWEFVAGRYFYEYLPVSNLQYTNGWISQGTATYAPIKVMAQLWAAYLIKSSTGENFLNSDAALGMQFFASHLMPNGKYFQTGDGDRSAVGSDMGFAEYFVSAALFNDSTALAWAKYASNNYLDVNKGSIFTMTADFQLCFISAVTAEAVDKTEELGLVQYFLDPAGQMTVRNSWSSDAATVLMKIGNMTMADHDAYEHGTFQIYYKGLLAGSSGAYKEYGGDTHYYYLQATVAHNGLLIFNPAKASEAKTNAEGYYYSGSQHRLNAPSTLEEWQNGTYRMAETTGADWGYSYDGSVKYAYIAGDITQAYDEDTVDYVGRRMFTLYTGKEDVPMLFLVFDEIISDEAYFEKTFLLHTIKEPEVDEENLTATVINEDGRLVLKSLFGADIIEAIGGEGKAYWINGYLKEDGTYVEGKNCLDQYTPTDNSENIWGRVQLRSKGSLETTLLTAMYVTDASSSETLDINEFKNEKIYGAQVYNNFIVFASGKDKAYKTFEFETNGTGLYNYYISGVSDGTWRVFVDGVSVAYSHSEDESGMISFIAPAGKIEIKPGANVIGANGGKIKYIGGGILPDDAPYSYNSEEPTALPTNVTRGDDKFLGWYTSPDYSEDSRIYIIPTGSSGTVTVYAKWREVLTNETYTDNVGNKAVYSEGKKVVVDNITYTSAAEGIIIETKTEEDGENTYLEVRHDGVRGQARVQISDLEKNISTINESAVSFEVSFAKLEGVDLSTVYWDLETSSSVGGSGSMGLITIKSDGSVLLCGSKNIGSIKDGEFFTVRIGIDFEKGTITAYNEDGSEINSATPKAPDGFDSLAQWQSSLKPHTLYLGIYNMNLQDPDTGIIESSAILIDNIKIAEGIIFVSSSDEELPNEGIDYNLGGGVLPADAPKVYDPELGTMLPTEVTRAGHIFAGWYTSEAYESDSRTYYVPAGTDGIYSVYAKWYAIITDETYTDNVGSGEISFVGNAQKSFDGVIYNSANDAISFNTVTDADGNVYLAVYHNNKRGQAYISTSSKTEFTSGAVSLEFKIAGAVDKSISAIKLEHQNAESSKYSIIDMMNSADPAKIMLVGGSSVIGTINEEGYTTFRITIDFATNRVSAYNENGDVIDSVPYQGLSASGKFNLYIYNLNTADADGNIESAGIHIDDLKLVDGAIWGEKPVTELPSPLAIKYELAGGNLPDGAPVEYDPALGTMLPADPTRNGFIFAGWYTSSAFDPESRVYYVPAGTEGVFRVYAKWFEIASSEDYSETEVNVELKNETLGGIIYSSAKAGITLTSESDGEGNTYLAVKHNGIKGQAVIRTTNTTYNFSTFSESGASFEISFSKLAGVSLSTVYWDLMTSSSVGGSGSMGLVTIKSDGSILLCGSEQIGTVEEGIFTTVRIAIDFAAGTISAYDGEGNIIKTMTPAAPTGFESLADWQRNGLKPHMLYLGIYNMNMQDADTGIIEDSAILIDGIKVVDGIIYGEKPITELPSITAIDYQLNGGTLPEDAPKEYDPEAQTALPQTAIRDGYIFEGWYTSESYEEQTRIAEIPAGTEGIFKVYAKWYTIATDEDYSENTVSTEATNAIVNGITYSSAKAGITLTSESDEEGNTYLAVKHDGVKGQVIIRTTNTAYNISTFEEDIVSFEISFSKLAGVSLSTVYWDLMTSSSVGGSGSMGLVTIKSDGSILLCGSEQIGTVEEGIFTTVRIAIDFAAGTISAYDGEGNIIKTMTPAAPTGFESLADWQRNGLKPHMLYLGIYNYNENDTDGIIESSAILIDGIRVVDGRLR